MKGDDVTTFEGAIREHRKMWKWIAIQSMKEKRKVQECEYLKLIWIDESELYCSDFCCHYVNSSNRFAFCDDCPLEWPGGGCCLCSRNENLVGLYAQWYDCNDYKKSAFLAYKISKLPERRKREYDL